MDMKQKLTLVLKDKHVDGATLAGDWNDKIRYNLHGKTIYVTADELRKLGYRGVPLEIGAKLKFYPKE